MKPIPSQIDIEFRRNGKPLPAANGDLLGHVERVLIASGVFTPTSGPYRRDTISVMANNIADIAAAKKKGFKTGLTFGVAGSLVDDNYEFQCIFRNGSGLEYKYSYQHAIHSTIGKKKVDTDVIPTKLAVAFWTRCGRCYPEFLERPPRCWTGVERVSLALLALFNSTQTINSHLILRLLY